MSDLGRPLPQEFYARPADRLAPALLGTVLAVHSEQGTAMGRIVETEAYVGEEDLACHAAKGLTQRTTVLYGPAGTAYVYLIYGMYDLFNVVAAPEGVPHAVLIRAVELLQGPLNGARGDGPGRLTRALGIDRSLNGTSLLGPRLTIHPGRAPATITVTPRVGVAYAVALADAKLRFLDADSRAVSRPSPRSIGRPG